MAYEYERGIIGMLGGIEDRHLIDLSDYKKELKEVYAKAKAWQKLREEKAAIEMYLDAVKVYKPMYECVNDKYKYLTKHIKNKALHNPGVHRYIDLVHVIDELEKE